MLDTVVRTCRCEISTPLLNVLRLRPAEAYGSVCSSTAIHGKSSFDRRPQFGTSGCAASVVAVNRFVVPTARVGFVIVSVLVPKLISSALITVWILGASLTASSSMLGEAVALSILPNIFSVVPNSVPSIAARVVVEYRRRL